MVDITVTPANVVAAAGAIKSQGTAGATITAGQPVYRSATDQKFYPCDADSATAAAHEVAGIALNGAAASQPVSVQTGGDINLGATLVAGTIYVASDTPGGIKPAADLVSGDYVSIIGVATTASNLKMGLANSGVAVPT